MYQLKQDMSKLREECVSSRNEIKETNQEILKRMKEINPSRVKSENNNDSNVELLITDMHSDLTILRKKIDEDVVPKIDSQNKKKKLLPCPSCPMCLEILQPPMEIMQCGDGHLVCRPCSQQLGVTRCPGETQCDKKIVGRARGLEIYLQSLFGGHSQNQNVTQSSVEFKYNI